MMPEAPAADDAGSRTLTLAITVPGSWYAAPDYRGTLLAWDSATTPHQPVLPSALDGHPLTRTLLDALPRMQWGYLSEDHLTRCTTEAQARVRAWLRLCDDPDAFVVARLDDGADWTDDCGLTYGVPDALTSPATDVMATWDGAVYWLHRASQRAASEEVRSDAADDLDALRREAGAHGHDVAELEV